MTPAEAIAILGGTVEAARAKITLAKNGPCSLREHDAIHALALHALTDSGAQEIRDIPSIDVVGLPDCDVSTEHNFGTNRITVTVTRKDPDSGARGALERVRELLITKFRMIDRGKYGWSYETGYPGFVVEAIDRELAALPPSPATAAQPAEQPNDSEAWVGKLYEDSAKVDRDVDRVRNSMRRCPLLETSFRVHEHENSGAFVIYGDEIEEAVRIMRTRGDALRQMEKDRNERADQVDAHQQLIDEVIVACGSLGLMASELPAHIASMRTELARLRAEMAEVAIKLEIGMEQFPNGPSDIFAALLEMHGLWRGKPFQVPGESRKRGEAPCDTN